MERTKACLHCPFKKKFPAKGVNLYNIINDYLKMNKGNFACHEQAIEFNCHPKQMRIEHPELNTCFGYQQMLSGRQPRIFIKKLKDMIGTQQLLPDDIQ